MNNFFHKNRSHIDLEKVQKIVNENKTKYRNINNKNFISMLEKLSNIQIESFNPVIKDQIKISSDESNEIKQIAKSLGNWRKGPFYLGDLHIDSEWRSDIKWNRLSPHIPSLKNKTILDIGCNNGYFMFEMLRQGPSAVLGIDPVTYCEAQFKFLNYFCQSPKLFFEMLGINEVKYFKDLFEVIFNMGIIYHHPNPIEQLIHCREALKKNGFMILESIVIAGEQSIALFPEDRYARMRNVWFIPTVNCMKNWLHKAKFKNIEIIFNEPLTGQEQRVTRWSASASLEDFLDPDDPTKTIEGHPSPRRAALIAYN